MIDLTILDDIDLEHGCHASRKDGVCVMEAAAWIAGEKHSDSPQCVSPIISAFLRSWNDALPDNEMRNRLLKPLVPFIINSRASKAIEDKRAFMAVDWGVRTWLPMWLKAMDAERYKTHTAALKALPEITDWAGLSSAILILVAAKNEAAATRDATWAAAWDAAWDAARDAARAAAGDAAGAAARDALRPTTVELQAEAHLLVGRLIDHAKAAS